MEFLLSYRKKHLGTRTAMLLDSLRRTMGVHSIVFHGYKASTVAKSSHNTA